MASIMARGNSSWRARVIINGRRYDRSFKSESLAKAWASSMNPETAGIFALRDAAQDHRIAAVAPLRQREAIKKASYSPAEIVAASMQLADQVGIYFLMQCGQVIYVGQTKRLLARLEQHRKDGRKFDAFSFIPCAASRLNELERTYVEMLMPPENKTFGGGYG